MERSEHNQYSICSGITMTDSNCEKDKMNDNTVPDWLIDDQNQATMGDQFTVANSWNDFVATQQENFMPTEEYYSDSGSFTSQIQVNMPNSSIGWNYLETVSPQSEMAVPAGNSELETVIGSLPASAEVFPANFWANEINLNASPDQLNDNQNQATIEDSLFDIYREIESFLSNENIWDEFETTNPQNQLTTSNSWDEFEATYQENFIPMEEYYSDAQTFTSQIQINTPNNSVSWNSHETVSSQNEMAVEAGNSEPGTVNSSLPASVEFSAAKHSKNGSQPATTLHQLVDSTTEETSTCHQGLQLPIPLTPNSGHYICTICNPNCGKTSGAETSRKNKHHSNRSLYPVTCKVCNVQQKIETLLKSSKPQDLSKEDYKMKCEHVMNNKELLSRERKYDNGKWPQFVCSFCSIYVKEKKALRSHLNSKHKIDNFQSKKADTAAYVLSPKEIIINQ